MNAQRRKALVALLGMGAAAALAKAGVPTKKIAEQWETDLETMFPAQFGDWQVDTSLPVILPAPDVQAKLAATLAKINADPGFIQKMEEGGFAMLNVGPDKMGEFMAGMKAQYGALAKEMGIVKK